MHRTRGPIACVASEAIDKGYRVRFVATPAGDVTGLPYVELCDNYLGDSPFIGVTDKAVAAGEVCTIHPVFSDFITVKVAIASGKPLYTGGPVYAAQSGFFTTDDGGSHVLCGYCVTPNVSASTALSVVEVKVMLTRWTYDT